MSATMQAARPTIQTLPGDDLRQIMWGYADRFDMQMLVQSVRAVARGPVARLVASGGRQTHEWTPEKHALLQHFDDSGITAAFMEPEHGGFIEGPKNMTSGLIAFELAWVDAGAATGSLAGNLALAPIHECGTPEQIQEYMSRCVPAAPGEDRETLRGAFALTEPLPYVGVDTGVLSGRVSVAEWKEGEEPILHVEKRGRFITNMDFADFATAAVCSGDDRIKDSCMVIVEKSDPGTFDRGAVTMKMVHQLSSTRDPVFNLKVPASRIIGGYTVKDGVIVPNMSHSEIIEAVFRRTRVTVGLMTAAKLLSAVEPVIRYQRQRFRGGDASQPGKPRFELGIQMKEDPLHRLVDVWATGEAAASLGFEATRIFDEYDPLERQKQQLFREKKIAGRRNVMKAMQDAEEAALELLDLQEFPKKNPARLEELSNDLMARFSVLDSVANVFCPASKLWNTGYGATMMREAICLMGGYGITEDCPGFLFHKWMDAQLEATYEGPEAVQRRQMSVTMTSPVFLAQFRRWIRDLRKISSKVPGTGACGLATAMEMWLWTLEHLEMSKDGEGKPLYKGNRQGVTFPLADALSWILGARAFILDTIKLMEKGGENAVLAENLDGIVNFYQDMNHVHTGRTVGEVVRICSELIHGYNVHPRWGDKSCQSCCFGNEEANTLDSIMPGLEAGASGEGYVGDELYHPDRPGPCANMKGLEPFVRMQTKVGGCLTGMRLAKDRAAQALTQIMIPEALDYPQ